MNDNEKKRKITDTTCAPMLAIGLMSGTSLDGIDASIIYTDGEKIIDLGACIEIKMPKDLRERLLDLSIKCRTDINFARECAQKQLDDRNSDEIKKLEIELTELHAKAVNNLLAEHRKNMTENPEYLSKIQQNNSNNNQNVRDETKVSIIGFHGQTIFHYPKTDNKSQTESRFTWQLGDGKLLSKLSGIKVVSQFRYQDVKAGGEGAPLAPLYHVARLKSNLNGKDDHQTNMNKRTKVAYYRFGDSLDNNYKNKAMNNRNAKASNLIVPTAIVNIGGVSNVTFVRSGDKPPLAFDCGPGNALIDDWVRFKTNNSKNFDQNGEFACDGKIHEDIINHALHAHGRYLSQMPPKSLDRNEFQNLYENVSSEELSVEDGAATLTRFTASCIALAVRFLDKEDIPKKWLICGGGRKNQTLMQHLKEELCTTEIINVDKLGWRGDAVEAECFGYLAVRVFYDKFTSLPSTTNCKNPVCGGIIDE